MITKTNAAEVASKLSSRARLALIAIFIKGNECTCKHQKHEHRNVLVFNSLRQKDNGVKSPCKLCDCKKFEPPSFPLKHAREFGEITNELILARIVRSDWDIFQQQHVVVLERFGRFVIDVIRKQEENKSCSKN